LALTGGTILDGKPTEGSTSPFRKTNAVKLKKKKKKRETVEVLFVLAR
jgi:hypothetical protein